MATRRVMAGAGITASAVLGMSGTAQAVNFTVNSLGDAGDGTCDATAGGCTLRDALDDAAANNNAPTPDQILFAASITGSPGTITLNGTELPLIDEPLYINGPDTTTLTVSANNLSRIFHVDGAGGVTVQGLTLTGGNGGVGGAVYSRDTSLLVSGSVVTGNSAQSNGRGGGVYATGGTLSIQASTISGNSAPGASGKGGGIAASSLDSLSIADSEITGNTVPGITGRGAGIFGDQAGVVTVQQSTIAGNLASGMSAFAGAAYLYEPASVAISDSTISGNRASVGAGGISVQYAPVTIDNSTFTDNDVTNPTFYTGALDDFSPGDPLTVRSTTIADNDGGHGYGGIYWSGPAPATLENSIVAGNAATDISPDLGGAGAFNAAFSLVGSTSGATVNTSVPGSNLIGQNPQLGALADNGGPTLTMEPAPGSPVIDCGSDTINDLDQRAGGFPRVVDQPNRTNSTAAGANGADIGAFEVASNPSISGACTNNAPPSPPAPTPTNPAPGPTGQRAAALKKCKKKPKGPKRKKCIRKARKLPV